MNDMKMNEQDGMDAKELAASVYVRELAALQDELKLAADDFARSVKLGYSGSAWGKIKNGTFSGNALKALGEVRRVLATYKLGDAAVELSEDGEVGRVVVFGHMADALEACEQAAMAADEHRLVIVCGHPGSGKSTTGRFVARGMSGASYIHARPSWGRSYLQMLSELARGLGISDCFTSSGKAESAILATLKISPRLMILDEANHFNRDGLNFLKTLLNETACALVLLTLPHHLARINAEHAEESRQLIRRAISIIHIPAVSSDDVMRLHVGLYPELPLNGYAPALTSAANRLHRMDTLRRVFEEASLGDDLPAAMARVEKVSNPAPRGRS